jgi:hypothetical protein
MDWCNTKGLSPKVQYPLMRDALNKTGRPIFFEMCEWGLEEPWKVRFLLSLFAFFCSLSLSLLEKVLFLSLPSI